MNDKRKNTKLNDNKSEFKDLNKSEERVDNQRIDTGSSDSTIPERATSKHTETSPKPNK